MLQSEVSSFFEAHPHFEENNEFRATEGPCSSVLVRSTLHFLCHKALNDIARPLRRLPIKIKGNKSNRENDFLLDSPGAPNRALNFVTQLLGNFIGIFHGTVQIGKIERKSIFVISTKLSPLHYE